MKRILFFAIVLFVMASCARENNSGKQKDEFLLDLIQKMTLDEKIGQMRQVNGSWGGVSKEQKQAIIEGKIGSILNEVNPETVNEIQRIAVEESRLGIPIIIGRDVIHGFKTIFPIPLGQAATWNPEIAKVGARIAASEARSAGVHWTFAPMIDISRDARWGRIAESCGEDPYLTSVMGAAMVQGFQGDSLSDKGSIVACAKHFVGYGAAEGGRDYNTTFIPETELRNIYLKPFQAAKEAGVGTFMSGFNDLNGVPASGNKFLLKQVLREEWKFEGFVVSDWASIEEIKVHGAAKDNKEAALKAITAGVHMEMATVTYEENLKALLEEGKVDEGTIDDAVYRILKIKKQLGLFDNPYTEKEDMNKFALPGYLFEAKKAAEQSFVLLQNKNKTLPLSRKIEKIAVVGPMANKDYEQLGTWIFDGDRKLSVTPLSGIKKKLGAEKVIFAEGTNYTRSTEKDGFAKALKAAKKSDVVVVCVGEESILSGEAHCRADINLPGVQEELILELKKAGKPIVMVVLAGRPLTIGSVAKNVDAILYGFHPGTMTGAALADLLVGDANPSGKLPVTFPKMVGQIPFYYNHKHLGRPADSNNWKHVDSIAVEAVQTSLGNTSHYLDAGFTPLYPFGFGLSYSNFEYKELTIQSPKVKNGDKITASVVLTNTGNVVGEEVVQLYVRDLVGDITRPVKELKAFRRVTMKPGESKTITFELNTSELAYYNQNMELVTESGDFHLWIGGSSDLPEHVSFVVE